MKDMEEVVSKKIDELHAEIQERTVRLDRTVKEFQLYASGADSYDIVTFLPGKIRDIEWERRRIEALEEQARMLVWMGKESQKR